MSARRFAAGLVLSLLASCYPYQQYYFVGHVYDGVTGAELQKYAVSLEYMTTTVTGTVDGTGYYSVGPLPPYQDFTITITAAGYRSFNSHNQMHPDPAIKTQESFYYDAYLFPTNLQSPAATININELGTTTAAAGNLRMQPTVHSATYGLTPVDIGGDGGTASGPQVWVNDDDLQAATFDQPFMAGSLSIAAGALVWGVAYDVTIYNVPNCAEFDSSNTGHTYTSGVDGDISYTLTPLVQSPLTLVFNSGAQPGVLTPDYTLTLVFNQPIQLDATQDPNSLTFLLNSNFTIDSASLDPTGPGNNLNPPPANMMPFDFDGVDYSIAGNTLTLTWDQTNGLETMDANDPIYSVTYGGLSSFRLMSVSDMTDAAQPISTFVGGADSVTVIGVAIPAQ